MIEHFLATLAFIYASLPSAMYAVDNHRCPYCVMSGQESQLYPNQFGSRTCMGISAYYDEKGVFHQHDCNTSSFGCHCSKNHYFFVTSSSGCAACKIQGKLTIVYVGTAKPKDGECLIGWPRFDKDGNQIEEIKR